MRISDWSSDVCSSDLPRTGTTSLYTLFAAYRAGNEFMERQTVQHCVHRERGEISEDAFRDYLHRRDREGGLEMDSASFSHFYLDQIGRASCRERVCQYV